jgi:prepilin-type N-terminal cleavage/methylation domain-containing protein
MKANSQDGFSYIEVMIALVILAVGILELLAGAASAVVLSRGQQQQLTAKHIGASALESLMSVKETDTARLGWIAVGNVGTNPDSTGINRGIFLTGFQQVRADAGPDEVIGTADDAGPVIPGYEREIVITDQCDVDRPSPNCPTPGTWPVKVRTVQITVRYFVGTSQRNERTTTVLTDYTVAQ